MVIKTIKNSREGTHLNRKYWQLYKKKIPPLPPALFQCAVGMALGDATHSKSHVSTHLKFEQGYKEKSFLDHLYSLFKGYCFMEQPGTRLELRGKRKGEVKSYWLRTFSHPSFTQLYNSFYVEKRKSVEKDFLSSALTARGCAYWVMSDGSLQKGGREMILHSSCFTEKENKISSGVINKLFQLNSRVIPHKKVYFALLIGGTDAPTVRKLLLPYVIPSLFYKVS